MNKRQLQNFKEILKYEVQSGSNRRASRRKTLNSAGFYHVKQGAGDDHGGGGGEDEEENETVQDGEHSTGARGRLLSFSLAFLAKRFYTRVLACTAKQGTRFRY